MYYIYPVPDNQKLGGGGGVYLLPDCLYLDKHLDVWGWVFFEDLVPWILGQELSNMMSAALIEDWLIKKIAVSQRPI